MLLDPSIARPEDVRRVQRIRAGPPSIETGQVPSEPREPPGPVAQPARRRRFSSSSTGIGPGSTPSEAAMCSETKSPIRTRSSSWARSPSPCARTSITSATTSRSISVTIGEASRDLGMLGVVAEVDESEHLAGHVSVLAPAGHLVVPELGIDRVERRALRVLVHLGLPPHRRRSTDGLGAVDQGDRPADPAGDDLGLAAG